MSRLICTKKTWNGSWNKFLNNNSVENWFITGTNWFITGANWVITGANLDSLLEQLIHYRSKLIHYRSKLIHYRSKLIHCWRKLIQYQQFCEKTDSVQWENWISTMKSVRKYDFDIYNLWENWFSTICEKQVIHSVHEKVIQYHMWENGVTQYVHVCEKIHYNMGK